MLAVNTDAESQAERTLVPISSAGGLAWSTECDGPPSASGDSSFACTGMAASNVLLCSPCAWLHLLFSGFVVSPPAILCSLGSHHMVLMEGGTATECAYRKPHPDTLLLCSKELTRCRPDIQAAFRHLGTDAAVSVYAALHQNSQPASS